MHYPMIVAFQVKYPWKDRPTKLWPEGYRNTFLTIWHVDPERDGSDDSCGWSYPRLTDEQRVSLRGLAWAEAHHPWFQRLDAKSNDDPIEVDVLMRGAVWAVARSLGIHLSWAEVCETACSLTNGGMDNFRSSLCHLPGYHTNFKEDTTRGREDTAYSLFSGIARHLLSDRRPWYRHPRWHLHHWRFQLHPWQQLRRRYWDRCCKCGKRGFPKGVSAVGNWDGDRIWHSTCDESAKPAVEPCVSAEH